MRFIKATVLARVASDEVEAAVAVAMLLSSDALIEILLSHFLLIQCEMRWPDVEEIFRFRLIATPNKVQAYCCIFRTNWWTMTNATVCESKQFPLFLWNFICPFSISTPKNSSSGYLADTTTNNHTNYHHLNLPPPKKDACFFVTTNAHTHGKRMCNTFLIPLPIRPSCCAPTPRGGVYHTRSHWSMGGHRVDTQHMGPVPCSHGVGLAGEALDAQLKKLILRGGLVENPSTRKPTRLKLEDDVSTGRDLKILKSKSSDNGVSIAKWTKEKHHGLP